MTAPSLDPFLWESSGSENSEVLSCLVNHSALRVVATVLTVPVGDSKAKQSGIVDEMSHTHKY